MRIHIHKMVDQPEVATLKRQRATIKAACTRIRTYVESIAAIAPSIITHLDERRAKLEHYWAEYNDVQFRLESLDESEGCDWDGFEKAYYALFIKIRDLISPSPTLRTSIFSPFSSSARDSDSSMHIRLPKLNLPTFFGKYDEWFPFFDIFNSVIHSNLALKYAKISEYASVTHRRRKRCNQFVRIVGR